MMNICPRCGRPYSREHRFCGLCGYNLLVTDSADFVTKRDMKVKDIQFELGVLYFDDGKFEQALAIFERILKKEPDNLQVMDMYNRTKTALDSA